MGNEAGGADDAIDCTAALEQLDDYLRQELTPELARRMRAHIESCVPCFGKQQFTERFFQMMRGSAVARCPDDLRGRVADAIRAEAGGR